MIAVDRLYAKFGGTRFLLPTEADIAALEKTMGTNLPAEYRSLLTNYNGGYFEDAPFSIEDAQLAGDCLKTLWGVCTPKRGTDLTSKLDIFDDNDPAVVLPFGYTMMGNLLLMELKGDIRGNVILKIADEQKYIFLAEDFLGFIEMLEV